MAGGSATTVHFLQSVEPTPHLYDGFSSRIGAAAAGAAGRRRPRPPRPKLRGIWLRQIWPRWLWVRTRGVWVRTRGIWRPSRHRSPWRVWPWLWVSTEVLVMRDTLYWFYDYQEKRQQQRAFTKTNLKSFFDLHSRNQNQFFPEFLKFFNKNEFLFPIPVYV
ncbi:uncharacterized protein LOC122244203 [Penaeus japonicus]|uniref:uncharacterized protein LOC122244203 n=1 Tax=Penaeus japonicus TaxID=27405 RepID=UPI001C70C52A|nr:uncharacterized protein LOC122244203 [Penaeus japonicus]